MHADVLCEAEELMATEKLEVRGMTLRHKISVRNHLLPDFLLHKKNYFLFLMILLVEYSVVFYCMMLEIILM